MESNDIAVRPAKSQQQTVTINSTARRAIVLRFPPTSPIVWPGEFLEVELPGDAPPDSVYALELRTYAPSVRKLTASQLWAQPTIVSSVAGKIRIPNLTTEPHFLKRNEHFCQVHAVYTPEAHSINAQLPVSPSSRPPVHQTCKNHSVNASCDPNNLPPHDIRAKLTRSSSSRNPHSPMLIVTASPSHLSCLMLTPRYSSLRSGNTPSQQT